MEGDFGSGEGSFAGGEEDDGDFVEVVKPIGGDGDVEGFVSRRAGEGGVRGEAGADDLLAEVERGVGFGGGGGVGEVDSDGDGAGAVVGVGEG